MSGGLETIKPGLWTTIQDNGRWGLQKYGVSPGGAMDILSYRMANWLIGNKGNEAALELTQLGPRFMLHQDLFAAICGADMRPTVDGHPVPMNRAVLLRKGRTLAFGGAVRGCRAYLAVAGGFEAPVLLGGRGAYAAAGLPGLSGRALQAGDRLYTGCLSPLQLAAMKRLSDEAGRLPSPLSADKWSIRPLRHIPAGQSQEPIVVRAVIGREFARLTEQSRTSLFEEPFVVLAQSDRMGYRLNGPKLELADRMEMISEASPAGTLQWPAGGEPILLMADRQTTGGYPGLLHAIAADLPKLGQARPGDTIRFEHVFIEDAHRIYKEQHRQLCRLERSIRMRWV